MMAELPRARSPLRRGLKLRGWTGRGARSARAARALPFEKGTETLDPHGTLYNDVVAARALPFEKGTETTKPRPHAPESSPAACESEACQGSYSPGQTP